MKNRILLVTPIYAMLLLLFVVTTVTSSAIRNGNVALAEAEASTAISIENLVPRKTYYEGQPTALYLPRLDLKLVISPGEYDISSQTWTLSSDKAHHATQTSPANNYEEGGLTLVYGHNTPAVLGVTKNIENGDIMEVETHEGRSFTYRYFDDVVVDPTDTSIFDYTGEPRLALMSCTGSWNESRRIMNFKLVSVEQG